jgi:hypothetical protein
MTKTLVKLAAAAGAAMALTACGGNNSVLNNAQLEVKQQNGQNVVALTTEINTSNLVISAVSLPISKDGKQLGSVDITNDITTGKSYLTVTFDYQSALGLPAPTFSSMLPNGTTVPLAGLDLSKMMTFDIGLGGSKLYLYYDQAAKKAVFGVAINVASLSIGQPANVFANFNFNNVTGSAGLYFGTATNTSGVGIFTNLSGVLFPSNFSTTSAHSKISFKPMQLTPNQSYKVQQKLWELNSSGEEIVIE